MKTQIEEKIEALAPVAEWMPGVVIIHELHPPSDFSTIYMSNRGLEELGVTLEELSEMGKEYHERFFNNEEMTDFMEKLVKLLENKDPNETFTFFQQVKLRDREDWVWHMGSTRIFHQDEMNNPTHLITVVFPVDQMKHIPNKAERLVTESKFFRENFDKFHNLGNRAKEVLRLVALGKSSAEIADELKISIETVNTHRKIIKRKLDISTTYEFTEYAHAYDLI